MEVSKPLNILWHRRWVIVITLVVTLSTAAVVISQTPPIYTASTTLRISPSGVNPLDYASYLYFDRLMAGYQEIGTSDIVVAQVAEELGVSEAPEYEVSAVSGTDLLQITVKDTDPVIAAETANIIAEILVNQGRDLYTSGEREAQSTLEASLQQTRQQLDSMEEQRRNLIAEVPVDQEQLDELDRDIEIQQRAYDQLLESYVTVRTADATRVNDISIIEPALVPDKPSGLAKSLQLVISGVLGLVGGLGLAIALEYFQPKIHDREHIEELVDAPVLSSVRVLRRKQIKQLADGSGAPPNSFRRLQANLLMLTDESNHHTILVASPAPNDGKTVVASNLALALAMAGYNTLVVDADLRRPSVHKIFGLDNEIGLSDVLRGTMSPYDAIQRSNIPDLAVLTAGDCPEDPTLLVTSKRMKAVLDELDVYYDFVLIDTPAFLGVPEAATVARMAEQTLLVVRHTPTRKDLEETVEALRLVGANIVGVVLNRVPSDGAMRYRRYYSATPTQPQTQAQTPTPTPGHSEDSLIT
jgi:capsular exopolysaccharide synthesis family protein